MWAAGRQLGKQLNACAGPNAACSPIMPSESELWQLSSFFVSTAAEQTPLCLTLWEWLAVRRMRTRDTFSSSIAAVLPLVGALPS